MKYFYPLFITLLCLVTFSAKAQLYAVEEINFGYSNVFNPTQFFLDDDEVTDAIPIGFNFEFFGNVYNEVYVSSNGFITFLPDDDNGCCSGQNIPNSDNPNGLIAPYWEDLNPDEGGTMVYQTIGSGSNQIFITQFSALPHYENTNPVSFQVKLFASTNIIEIHCLTCTSEGASDDEFHTQGIENELGTEAYFVKGRNSADFSLSFDAVSFLPVPFAAFPFTTSVELKWIDLENVAIYQIERSLDGVNFSVPEFISAETTSFTDTDLSPGSEYSYRLTVNFQSGESQVFQLTVVTLSIIYVDANAVGNNDGSTWDDAYTDLSDALDNAGRNQQIWVANTEDGYTPGFSSSSSFEIRRTNLELYGGFKGFETDLNQRSANSMTVLDGDLGEGYIETIITIEDGLGNILIDGFEITHADNDDRGDGGGIYTESSLTVSNSLFYDNTAYSGGAIYSYDDNDDNDEILLEILDTGFDSNEANDDNISLTILNTVFNSNEANDDGNGDGGAIYFESAGTLHIADSDFDGNSADLAGGAIYVYNASTPTIQNSSFTENYGEDYGGAIYVASGKGGNPIDLSIIGGSFIGNQSDNYGGAIYFDTPGSFYSDESEFRSNSSSEYGGAIYLYNATPTINSTVFSSNSAARGGGVYVSSGGPSSEINFSASNDTFEDNTAEYGGAIYFSTSGEFNIEGSEFKNNDVDEQGGAIYMYNGTPTIEGTTFENNDAGWGGAIYVSSGRRGGPIEMSVSDGIFSNNTAIDGDNDGEGGAIYFSTQGLLSISQSQFTENITDYEGGAIYLYNGDSEIRDVVFSKNEAYNAGGAIYAASGEIIIDLNLDITESTFSGNKTTATVELEGGGAFFSEDYDIDIDNSGFFDNTSDGIGGGINHSNGDLKLSNSLLYRNIAFAGGAIVLASNDVIVYNSTFSGNIAEERGGALELRGGGNSINQFDAFNNTFSSNEAGSTGGAIHWGADINSEANIFHSTIVNNTATGLGGGISIFDDIDGSINFSNNIVAGNTGAGNSPDISLLDQSGSSIGINSLGNNLIGDVGDFFFGTNTTGDQYGDTQDSTTPNVDATESATAIDPLIGSLADNSGDTPTHALLAGSPAINFGSVVQIDGEDLLRDQRGFLYVGTPDIGAFENSSAPILDNSLTLTLTNIDEDDVNNAGDLLTGLSGATVLVSGVNGPGSGYAITSADASAGSWQFSLNNGTTWINFGSVSATSALLLPLTDMTKIRLVPSLNFNGTVTDAIAFKAWDQISGTAGEKIDASIFTAGSPFSEATETASITVNPINDIPILNIEIDDFTSPAGDISFVISENTFTDIEDGVVLTYSATGLPTWLSFDPATRTFSGTASSTDGGTSVITVTATDSGAAFATDEFSLTVTAGTGIPIVVNPIADQEIPLGRYSFTFAENVFSDSEDGTTLNFSVTGLPTWLEFDAPSRTFSGRLVSGTSGSVSITVIATDSDGNTGSDSFDITINPLLSVEDNILSEQVNIYPVPNNGIFKLSIQNDYVGLVRLKVLDMLGRDVYLKEVLKTPSTLETDFNLNQLGVGVYFIEINAGQLTTIKRFIVN